MSFNAGEELTRKLGEAVERRLDALTPLVDQAPAELHGSMRHTLMAPGKRARAMLAMLTAADLGGRDGLALSSACALEMVHAASLILDDLPAMDDASLRRGRPTNHTIYGEATAILASIGLLNRAFGVIAEDEALTPAIRVALAQILSRSVGSDGLVAGQEQDLKWRPDQAGRKNVEQVHARKTAALFSAAAEMGAVAVAASPEDAELMADFGLKLGLAFQILDDVLDATASAEMTGKDVNQDGGRPSLVLCIGLEAAQEQAHIYMDGALAQLSARLGEASALRRFALRLLAHIETKLNAPRQLRQMSG